jgi:folate-binding protein YgfZ
MTEEIIALPERRLVSILGEDAAAFLQGLVTIDVTALKEGTATYCGLLTPQGKILFDFLVSHRPQGFLIDCVGDQRDDLLKRLGLYKLRAKIAIAPEDGLAAYAILSEEGDGLADSRPGMGERIYHAAAPPEGEHAHYHSRRIELGFAEGGHDFAPSTLFPHEAGFDQFGALSFTKGCFVGQEVVSRMEHRGTARSRIVPARVEGALPTKDTPVTAGSTPLGRVLSGTGELVLALIRLDRLAEATAAGSEITAGESMLFPYAPPWASFDVPARESA